MKQLNSLSSSSSSSLSTNHFNPSSSTLSSLSNSSTSMNIFISNPSNSSSFNSLLPSSSYPSSSSSLFKSPPINMWCLIPSDLSPLICQYLDVDSCGYLYMISKQWSILPTEEVYKRLCYYIFISQTKLKKINVNNWGSWKNMLIYRPRIRTNGIYSLRTSYWKPPVNDRFWEEKIREFPEAKFYRHLKFFHNGKVLYSLCNISGNEIYQHMEQCIAQPNKKIYEGTYELKKDAVTVHVPVHYADMKFVFLIRNLCGAEEGGSDDLYSGNHNVLKLIQHTGEITRQNHTTTVQYEIPMYANFLFHRFWLGRDD